ncbi:hypothetical protein HK102_009259, partial [Quaeritorhiza haematococci]
SSNGYPSTKWSSCAYYEITRIKKAFGFTVPREAAPSGGAHVIKMMTHQAGNSTLRVIEMPKGLTYLLETIPSLGRVLLKTQVGRVNPIKNEPADVDLEQQKAYMNLAEGLLGYVISTVEDITRLIDELTERDSLIETLSKDLASEKAWSVKLE